MFLIYLIFTFVFIMTGRNKRKVIVDLEETGPSTKRKKEETLIKDQWVSIVIK